MMANYVDNYCERLDIGLLAEPINAITNVAFLTAAFLLFKQYKIQKMQDMQTAVLIALVAVIGLGSLAFHTLATHSSMLADIIPIGLFVFFYLWIALRRLIGIAKIPTALCLLMLLVAALLTRHISGAYSFNGSIAYFPCLIALLIIGTVLSYRHHPAAKDIHTASIVFVASLTFRSIDMSVCDSFPLGTHFLWHICNGVVLYILTKAISLHTAHSSK